MSLKWELPMGDLEKHLRALLSYGQAEGETWPSAGRAPLKEQSPTRGGWGGFISLRERAEPATSAFVGGHWPLLPVQNCLRKTIPASWEDVL